MRIKNIQKGSATLQEKYDSDSIRADLLQKLITQGVVDRVSFIDSWDNCFGEDAKIMATFLIDMFLQKGEIRESPKGKLRLVA